MPHAANALLTEMGFGSGVGGADAFRADRGEVLVRAGEPLHHCYFPEAATLLALNIAVEGGSVVTQYVGREGCVGFTSQPGALAFLGVEVCEPGRCIRVPLYVLGRGEAWAGAGRRLARYGECFLAHTLQLVACAAAHTLEQRAARLMLETAERMEDLRLSWTQDELGRRIGVGRTVTNRLMKELRLAGLISVRRGGIEITDIEALRRTACGCHAKVREIYAS